MEYQIRINIPTYGQTRPGEQANLPELDDGPDELSDDSGTDEEYEEEMQVEDPEVDLEEYVAAEAAELVSTPKEKRKGETDSPLLPKKLFEGKEEDPELENETVKAVTAAQDWFLYL